MPWELCPGVRGIESFTAPGGYPAFRVRGQDRVDLCPAVYDLAHRNDWAVRELRPDLRTLETVFNELGDGGVI